MLGKFLCWLPSVGALKDAPAHRVASLKEQPVRRDFCGAAGCRVFFSRWRLYRQVVYRRLSSFKFQNKKFWPHANKATPGRGNSRIDATVRAGRGEYIVAMLKKKIASSTGEASLLSATWWPWPPHPIHCIAAVFPFCRPASTPPLSQLLLCFSAKTNQMHLILCVALVLHPPTHLPSLLCILTTAPPLR